jgi:hypothetical protein
MGPSGSLVHTSSNASHHAQHDHNASTGRPRGKSNESWRLVGVFDTEGDMQKERLAQKVSKRKVDC